MWEVWEVHPPILTNLKILRKKLLFSMLKWFFSESGRRASEAL